jgi:hypothetical protein
LVSSCSSLIFGRTLLELKYKIFRVSDLGSRGRVESCTEGGFMAEEVEGTRAELDLEEERETEKEEDV